MLRFGGFLQKTVSFLQYLVIPDQVFQIFRVKLRKQGIHKAPSFLRTAGYQNNIIRSNKNNGETTNMGREFGTLFLVNPKFLLPVFTHDTNRFMVLTLLLPVTLQPETLASDLDGAGICTGKIAFCKAQVVNRIQEIGLSNAIRAGKAYNPLREGEFLLSVITELRE